MPLAYTHPPLKTIFPQGCIYSIFKKKKSVKELLAPSLYPNKKGIRTNLITSCYKFDIVSQAVSPIEDIIQGVS